MFKRLLTFIKKIILAVLFIYAFNKMAISFDLFIPINVLTVFLVLYGGIPSIVFLAVLPLIII